MMKNNPLQKALLILVVIATIFWLGPRSVQAQEERITEIQTRLNQINGELGPKIVAFNPGGSEQYKVDFFNGVLGLKRERLALWQELKDINPGLVTSDLRNLETDIQVDERELAKHQANLAAGITQTRTNTSGIGGITKEVPAAAGKCGWFTFWNCVPELISAVGEFLKQVFGLVLWLAGKFFDKSVEYSITSFATLANSPSVQLGWKTLRDVANLFFIFILLYAAIGMILQLPSVNGKRILVSVIVVALLINFSAFFTRLVIDASNVVANQFYNAVSKSETARIGVGEGQKTITGISATFMNALPIHSVLADAPGRTIINAVGISFGAVIMMLVAIFIFLAAAILFVVRTVSLLFVIILSPLAFLMWAFPNQKGLFDKWLDTLLKQAFFAPLYLLMVWVTIKFLKGGALEQILAQEGSSPVLITLNFLIAIGFMFGALIIAKSLGAKGASAAMKGAGALTGAATGAALWGSKQLRRVGVAAGAGVAGGAGAIFGKGAGIRKFATSQLKDIKTDTQKVVTSGQGKIGKAVREFTQAPIKKTLGITAGGLAAVTKDYGIGGILGRTKDEEAEARKKEKERKEAENKAELKRKGDQLRGNPQNAASIMASIKDKDISEIDSKVLVQHGQYMRASQLAEAMKHLNPAERTAIRNAITAAVIPAVPAGAPGGALPIPSAGTSEQRQAWDWLTHNNAGKIF